MKKSFLIILFLSGFASIHAQIASLPFSLGIFDIDFILRPHIIRIENNKSEQVDTHYNFTDRNRTYELRYTLFRQTEKDVQNIRSAVAVMGIMTMFNIAGYEFDLSNISPFNDNDVKKEFNGDFGFVHAIMNPISDYAKGYNCVLVEVFYKNNIGIVVRTIMTKDVSSFMNLYESAIYDEIYHSFKFKN